MKQFNIQFKECPILRCELHSTDVANQYFALLQNQYESDSTPIFRDPQLYSFEYFACLAQQASTQFGWDWVRPCYDLKVTTQLHKDLEQFLQHGYQNIPEQYDTLLHELHYALHAIESGSQRNHWLQIEWFNDNGFEISSDQYPAKLELEFGDLRLQNPYVGHHPLYVYQQQDHINIMQTCRFHDFVKPGINIVVKNITAQNFDWQHYINWFATHCPEFLQTHSVETLQRFTGHPVVGRVINLDDLETVLQHPVLQLQCITFGTA